MQFSLYLLNSSDNVHFAIGRNLLLLFKKKNKKSADQTKRRNVKTRDKRKREIIKYHLFNREFDQKSFFLFISEILLHVKGEREG